MDKKSLVRTKGKRGNPADSDEEEEENMKKSSNRKKSDGKWNSLRVNQAKLT